MFLKFLEEVTGVNEKARRDIQKMFGYTLMRTNRFKKAFMLLGPPNCGKSIILAILDAIHGNEIVSHITLQKLCNGNQFATSALYGKVVNTCGDLPREKIEDTGNFKTFVGGDRVSIEEKNKPTISYLPIVRFVYAANKMPEVKKELEDDTAYYDR